MNATAIRRCACVVLAGLLLAAQSGCGAQRKGSPMTPEQAAALKTRLGAIATAAARFQPNLVMKKPAKGAAQAAGKGALLDTSAQPGNGASVVLGLLLAPTAKVAESRDAALKAALADMHIQEAISERLLAYAKVRTSLHFEPVEAEGPSTDGGPVDYRPLKAKGIDTVQETGVLSFGLDSDGTTYSDLSLKMRLRLRLVRTEDNSLLLDRIFDYAGPKRKFYEWESDEGKLFREELERCYRELADSTVYGVYFLDTLGR